MGVSPNCKKLNFRSANYRVSESVEIQCLDASDSAFSEASNESVMMSPDAHSNSEVLRLNGQLSADVVACDHRRPELALER